MMNMKVIAVGSVKEAYYRNKIELYRKRTAQCRSFELIELKDESIPKGAGESVVEKIKDMEGEKILEHILPGEYVVALCIDGRATTEDKLHGIMEAAEERAASGITFVIGGSLGLGSKVIKRADYRMSFSRMTFPHQLMRVMLLAQLAKL